MSQSHRNKPSEAEFMQSLRERFAHGMEQLVEEARLVTAQELKDKLMWTDAQLAQAESAGQVFGLEVEGGSRYYPSFFCDDEIGEAANAVSCRLQGLTAVEKWIFFGQSKHLLNEKSPIEALKAGALDAVLRAAEVSTRHTFGRKG